jgi:hypothetical protein
MGGAILPLPQYAFMAWCSVSGRTETTLPFFTFILISNTLSLLSSLSVRGQVSHPYKTTCKSIILNILIFNLLDMGGKTDSELKDSKHSPYLIFS